MNLTRINKKNSRQIRSRHRKKTKPKIYVDHLNLPQKRVWYKLWLPWW